MSRDDLEKQILNLWVQTRIPLTRAHLQYVTGASRRELESWLDALTTEGVLSLDIGTGGEIEYSVPGAERPKDGPTTLAEVDKKSSKRARKRKAKASTGAGETDDLMLSEAITIAQGASRAVGRALQKPTEEGKKSLAVSAGLSLLGPPGWLYAGHLKEAIPASLAFLLALKFLPSFLLSYLLIIGVPASAIAGMIYAWQYNREGKRRTLFLKDKDDAIEEQKKARELESLLDD